jgi:hypothetical protein
VPATLYCKRLFRNEYYCARRIYTPILINSNLLQRVCGRHGLETDLLRIRQQLDEHEQTTTTFEPLETLISFRNRAIELFRRGDNDAKRFVFGIIGSNPVLKDKILSIEAKRPFRIVSNGDPFPQMRAVVEDIRTLWVGKDPELLEILNNINALYLKCGIRPVDAHRLAA